MSEPNPADDWTTLEGVDRALYLATLVEVNGGELEPVHDVYRAHGVPIRIRSELKRQGYAVVPRDLVDPDEIAELLAEVTPHVCVYCKGTGWVEDEGWTHYPYGKGSFRERREHDGYLICGGCGGGEDLDIDERTEPTMVVDGWTSDEEERVAALLRRIAEAVS